ncbi:hypothetical protein PR202_gb18179 [Eleusine coracana subsp. coracana]|uniref:Pentatricopeptide repeat-containing protein n=1 Tax=Eleusine coracana subsp. coracana TaxID=191504 RepID=A0AAV5F4Q9_ELECO|nr:hypothetical protein PR202_gb18179 [Eleusine coracana subsp. coracana]
MPSPSPGIPRRRSPPAITSLLSRLRAAAGATSPQRLLFQTLALVLTSGLSSSHPAVSSRLLNSLLPHVDRHRLPALLRLLPRDHLTLLLLSAKHHVRSLPAASALHAIAVSSGHLPADLRLANSLLSLYLSLGSPSSARHFLADIPRPDTVTWNTLLRACLRMGLLPAALRLFDEMPERDVVTYNSMLAGYAAGGVFDRMVRFYNIEPMAEHFGCMMDLLGRAGLLKDSENLLTNLQGKVSHALWGTLLSASRTQNNSKLGEFVGRKLIEMKPTEVGPYVLLSNIYATEGRWDDVEKVREMMKDNGVEKDIGLSLVGSNEIEPCPVAEGNVLSQRSGVMLTLLGEIGLHMKKPSEESSHREGGLLAIQ